ncbi:MAG: hypothetical protein KDD40_00150 [Bdellovibrionales bacterium]|nr:hypothetical protein [Bdellovibrionales bacterium]
MKLALILSLFLTYSFSFASEATTDEAKYRKVECTHLWMSKDTSRTGTWEIKPGTTHVGINADEGYHLAHNMVMGGYFLKKRIADKGITNGNYYLVQRTNDTPWVVSISEGEINNGLLISKSTAWFLDLSEDEVKLGNLSCKVSN